MMARAAADGLIEAHGLATSGAPLTRASAVIVALHGRGAEARSILSLVEDLALPDVAGLAPQAAGRSWWPASFMAPAAANEPALGRSLRQIADLLDALEAAGVPPPSTVLLGFSQGACLAIESAVRRPRPYGGVLGLAGGYVGPPGPVRAAAGSLAGAAAALCCGTADGHIPEARVRETAALMQAMGAAVDLRLYRGFGHAVNDDMLAACRTIVAPLAV